MFSQNIINGYCLICGDAADACMCCDQECLLHDDGDPDDVDYYLHEHDPSDQNDSRDATYDSFLADYFSEFYQ